MKVKHFLIFNTFGDTDIKNSKKAILNNVIETYKNELLLNKDGCIFVVHNNLTEGLC